MESNNKKYGLFLVKEFAIVKDTNVYGLTKKPDANCQYRKGASSNTSDDDDNEDIDTDISDSDSSEDSKHGKIETHGNKFLGEIVDKPEVKKESITAIKKVDVKDTSPNEEPKEETKEVSKDEKVEKTESKPK